MNYTLEISIDLPRETVIEKLDNADNLKHWQRGLTSYEHLSGTPGEEGAKSKLHYKTGKRTVTLVETIIERNFPDALYSTYETKGVFNMQKNYFTVVDANTTKWVSESEFKFTGFMMKIMGAFMSGTFKKQSYRYMEDFKNFAEKGLSVSEAS